MRVFLDRSGVGGGGGRTLGTLRFNIIVRGEGNRGNGELSKIPQKFFNSSPALGTAQPLTCQFRQG